MSALALEMQTIVKKAAYPMRPGDTVKGQMNRAWRSLQMPPFWRVRAAWYGEAGCWGGAAIEDMRSRNQRRLAKEQKAREQADDATAVLAALREGYAETDPEFFREQIQAIGEILREQGHSIAVDREDDSPVAEPGGE